ncbi:Major Facilitator Superfamily/Sugar (and other) transporter, putative [Angomonas deanei]|uniref:Major Facilitator Superfamily/Sugar (And other) transporter, putative n=1 Tax=Angomonas deanei TaxID=59799 RepID=A0A7G2CBD4_9TRYP|nr:Major Facilitator Superfamily/Sugar (and other) transporter, putative [Angomonas deanei]
MGQDSQNGEVPERSDEESRTPTDKITPLPKKATIATIIVLLSEPIFTSLIMPFVGLFVAHLCDITPDKAGYKSGLIVGLFMLGQVLSCKLWGFLSDTYGRRPSLMASLASGAVLMLLFGLSNNFYLSCVIRFVQGFLNGSRIVAKAIVADITDSTNQAKGFAIVSVTWAVGFIFGSVFGGFLYDPVNNDKTKWMGLSKGGFLDQHPAFLPCFVITVYNALAITSAVILLPETNKDCVPFSMAHLYSRWFGKTATEVTVSSVGDANGEEEVLATPIPRAPPTLTYAKAMQLHPIRNIALFYMLVAASDIAYAEILGLWIVAKKPEGLEGFADDVAVLNLCFSVPALVSNIFFQNVVRKFNNDFLLWRLSTIVLCSSLVLTPFATLFPSVAYYWTLVCGLSLQVGMSWLYSLVYLISAKVSPRQWVASVYAVSQTFASLARCVVPFVVSPLFAWSIDGERTFPLNHCLVFFLAAVPPAVTGTLSLTLDFRPVVLPTADTKMETVDVVLSDDDQSRGYSVNAVSSSLEPDGGFRDAPVPNHEESLRLSMKRQMVEEKRVDLSE